ncbi:hypothetical protein ACHAQH_009893 [Verticillium albo-atrum]
MSHARPAKITNGIITALGLYEAEINVRRVGDHALALGWQSYNHLHIYDTYDVTECSSPAKSQSLTPLSAKADGQTVEIPTDASWKSLAEGPVTSGEIYNGEHLDDRIAAEVEGWATRSFNGSSWPGTRTMDKLRGRLASPDQPPIRATEEIKPQRIFKFHSNVRWSMKGNLMSIPTDCPQRDERAGWTGDAHMFGPTANYLYDTAGFWRGWHRDIWSEMSSNGKMIPFAYTPTLPSGFGDQMPTAIWGDVVVASPWNTFQAFGDAVLLREHLPQAQNWIDKGIARNTNGLWDRTTFQFADWLDPETPYDNPAQSMTSQYLVADAYLIQMTGILADIVDALGESGDVVDKYRSQRSDLEQLFQKEWINEDLEIGIEVLRESISNNDYLVGTGFAGTAPLGHALTKANATEDFYRMLLQENNPSWLYHVVMGGTTTC